MSFFTKLFWIVISSRLARDHVGQMHRGLSGAWTLHEPGAMPRASVGDLLLQRDTDNQIARHCK